MVRILGSTGSRRRRRYQLAAIFSVTALLAAFAALPAQAVHNIGVFELDGNATTGAHSGLPDDWDRVCHQVLNADCSTTVNTTGATGVSFVSEPNRSTSIFTGGGSKDDLDITGWAWKNAGGLPDKDNLRDGFAARYTCVTASGCTGTAGDSLLYFGADRFDNSGDAAIGFWFLQGDVSNLSDGTFGPDAHTAGDILILSDFTKGGGLPTIRVFAWDPTCSSGCNPATDLIDGTLLPLGGGLTSPADCPSQGANDPFCAVVNGGTSNTLSPWTFTDKSKNTAFAPGEFYEGGINLTQLQVTFPGLAGECFASFSAETRTSQSTDAVLKDFIIGAFQPCESGIVTTPSNTTITFGQSITDSAVVTGTGAGTPTGKVKFFVCDPTETSTDTNGDPVCTSPDGTQVTGGSSNGGTDGETLAPDPNDTTKATATSGSVTPDAVGTWCFRGEYVPAVDSLYDPSTDDTTTECFEVVTIPTAITTSQSWFPNDSADISTTGPTGYDLTGSVRFRLYSNSGCTGAALYDQTVNIPASAGLTETVATTNGNGADGTDEAPTDVAISAATGTYSWLVEYTPAASDTAHTGSTRVCHDEHSLLTITNDDPNIP